MSEFIPIDKIETGMELAEPVVNNFGQIMVPAGFEIKDKHIRLIKTWNISGIMIKGENDGDDIQISPQILESVKNRVEKRMSWKANNEIEKDLFNSVIRHLAIKAMKSR